MEYSQAILDRALIAQREYNSETGDSIALDILCNQVSAYQYKNLNL